MSNQSIAIWVICTVFAFVWGALSMFAKDKAKSDTYQVISNIWICGMMVIAAVAQ